MPEALSAALFDLDGTLVETAPDLCAAVNHALEGFDRPSLAIEQVRHMVGDGARALIERGLRASGGLPAPDIVDRLVERMLAHYWQHIADASRPFEGVEDTLQALADKGFVLAVCTNKPLRFTTRLLRVLQLERYFAAVFAGDSLPVKKPDPGHVLGTLAAIGARPAAAAMVGDSANDVRAGRAAGTRTVAVSFGYSATPVAELGADCVIDHFAELPEALARLAR
ncbi:MAG: phosphoglycolate phosphatase [Alphaproteobacteria bacterium]|nr:phosphoglycolate phosphatase [Alphaproteobacteria bacterium]